MDAQILKGLAEPLRAYLASHDLTIKHGHALDLLAALPGLRNWPEVLAFPARVAEARLDDRAIARLIGRLKVKHGVAVTPKALERALLSERAPERMATTIWPDGPMPGLYVATSEEAVDAAIRRYQAATDSALTYTEGLGADSGSAINLGDSGLFSPGLSRLPSGTLLVLGPLLLVQESWRDHSDRMICASNLVQDASVRVIVLVETPQPANLHRDIDLLLRLDIDDPQEVVTDVLGIVTEDGEMLVKEPFVDRHALLPAAQTFTTTRQLPEALSRALEEGVRRRPFGCVVLGTGFFATEAKGLLEATIPLTDHAGPAARVIANDRIGYGGEAPLSEYFRGLPVLPSIESAHAHGYRRIIIERPDLSSVQAMAPYTRDTCFLVEASAACDVETVWSRLYVEHWANSCPPDAIVALLAVQFVKTKRETLAICDAYIGSGLPGASSIMDDEFSDQLLHHRFLRWQDQAVDLLSAGRVSVQQLKKSLRHPGLEEFLSARKALSTSDKSS